MRGTKRFAAAESSVFTTDSNQNKRILAASPFDSQRAEPSQQLSVPTPQLDMQRAESSRQHVRALNTQFASWVQTQLQNYPDELWEDGAQDYLSHAASIMEKFSDVVNWLKANAAQGKSTTFMGFQPALKTLASENKENKSTSLLRFQAPAPKTLVSENKENNSTLSLDKPPTPAPNASSSFGTSWNSGPLFNNKAPFSFGLQSSFLQPQNAVATNNDTSNDADGEEDVEQPSSPSVKKTEEKGVTVVHQVKCKLYVKSSDPTDKDAWKDRGTGQLSIKCKEGVSKGARESKPTILIRNDVGRVVLNALLYPGIKTNMQKNSIVAIFHTSDGENSSAVVAQTCLIRLKSVKDRDKLAAIIQEYAPAA
ncbi:PREDICTED: uncharacterized protein LOC109152617 [Ipomoea nil]|uniref:uncharacterized protein LOC109152617 n=1 Tax=Ipomoea nil TaxID=35883 RepID=UPI0009017F91|nr:PREDICTED: uncharacterized protein LOC109152617 [Ipomoea nil]